MSERNFSLQGLIDQHIAKLPEKEYNSWRCSSLGGCPRSHFYKRLGIEPTSPPDERTQRVFEVGNIFHEWIQGLAEKETDTLAPSPELMPESDLDKGDVDSEVEIYDEELDLGGRYDMLFTTGGGRRILFDIKTQHSRAFWWMLQRAKGYKKKDGTYVPPVPIAEQKKEHRQQLAGYMLMLKRQGNPVDEGRILYVSKDDLCMEEITYYLTPELEKLVMDEVGALNLAWKTKTLPMCTCATLYDGKGVDYCSYREGSTCCSPDLHIRQVDKQLKEL